jgi:hypothetical protein
MLLLPTVLLEHAGDAASCCSCIALQPCAITSSAAAADHDTSGVAESVTIQSAVAPQGSFLLLLLTVPLEHAGDDAKGRLPDGHLVGKEVTRTLGHLQQQQQQQQEDLACFHLASSIACLTASWSRRKYKLLGYLQQSSSKQHLHASILLAA